VADEMREQPEKVDSVEASGSTVEEAVKRALLQLNASLDDVDIEIIDSGGSRLLRRGREARVRITLRDRPYSEQPDEDDAPVPPSPAAPPPPAAAVVAESREADREEAKAAAEQADREEAKGTADQADRESRAQRSDRTLLESGDDLQEAVEDILSGLLDRMGFVGDFEIVSEDPLTYNIIGDDDFGKLIGEHGETLRAFGYLLNLMVGRRLGQPCRVIVDVAGYRQRRAEQLAELAETLAAEVRETQEPVTLEAMPANERRLVHIALVDDDEVRTYSIGEGDERRVVISPKG
jgi:spoIIIJ-associated protein